MEAHQLVTNRLKGSNGIFDLSKISLFDICRYPMLNCCGSTSCEYLCNICINSPQGHRVIEKNKNLVFSVSETSCHLCIYNEAKLTYHNIISDICNHINEIYILNLKHVFFRQKAILPLCDALKHNTTVKVLDISGCLSSRESKLSSICELLTHNKTITSLNISSCGLNSDSVKRIVNSLIGNKSSAISDLNLSENFLFKKSCQSIIDLLINYVQIRTLNLQRTFISHDDFDTFNPNGIVDIFNTISSCPWLTSLDIGENSFFRKDRQDVINSVIYCLKHNQSLTHLNICGSHIGYHGMVNIANSLDSYNISHLNISGNYDMKDAMHLLTEKMKNNKKITSLILNQCNLSKYIKDIADLISTNTTIRILKLGSNVVVDSLDIKYLYHALEMNNNILTLDLSWVLSHYDAAKYIGKYILKNKTLKVLNIQHNGIDRNGMQYISKCMRSNYSLIEMHYDIKYSADRCDATYMRDIVNYIDRNSHNCNSKILSLLSYMCLYRSDIK